MFRATAKRLHCRITFFTRTPCPLCDNAKAVVQSVNAKRPLDYHQVNVMEPGQEKWKAVYEFDTPVIHIDRAEAASTSTSSLKLMHRFNEADVMALMDKAEREAEDRTKS
ncbi:hypothetical protein BDW02DRAFT_574605 [Decorospora gaudefroyi]|uniref:Glutaredoxin-like protein n=1 Tax=Decorospora gaudefroyi TaxID=184978 RepID=A0A6A5K2H4_9PLEO|nr:hypothetical protein BDW02DRAFT_574605 [Decorospora gaudefroyi]